MTDKLSSKRWIRLIPVVFITYSLAYVDRANFGFAAADKMAPELGITPSISSLLGSLFFLGYFFFQIPGAYYAAHKSAKKLIFWALILWGMLAAATGLVSQISLLIAVRFMLGVVESAVMPAMLILLSHWFTRHERSKANTFLILGNPVTVLWMSVLSGYLINSMGWRWMFIIEGAPAIIWAFIWWIVVAERPENASWLTQKEKDKVTAALLEEQKNIVPVKNYKEAFTSKRVILLCAQYLLWCFGVYGFVMWLPSMIKSAPDMNIVKTGWLTSVPYIAAILGMIASSYYSDRMLNRSIFIWPSLMIGSIALYGSYLAGPNNFWISFVLLVIAGGSMYAPYGPFFSAITEILPANVSGGAIGLINSMGALGSFAGAYIVGFLKGYTGGFGASYLFMSGALLISALITLFVIKSNSRIQSTVKAATSVA